MGLTTFTSMAINDPTMSTRESVVPNFRRAYGLKNIYRSAAPDELKVVNDMPQVSESEQFILNNVTLMVDLRSPEERHHAEQRILHREQAKKWDFENISGVEELTTNDSKKVYAIPPELAIGKDSLFEYASQNWISPEALAKASGEERQELIYRALEERGLAGFAEYILEANGFVDTVLKVMTVHLEHVPNGNILIHCNIGKDRTGVLAMLCQSILGVTDEEITEDFTKSSCIYDLALVRISELFKGHVDASTYAHANPETITTTLQYIRTKYGSVEKYLDFIGFDASWRSRLATVLQ